MTRTCAGRLHTLWDGEREGGNADRMEIGCGREARCRFYVCNKISFFVYHENSDHVSCSVAVLYVIFPTLNINGCIDTVITTSNYCTHEMTKPYFPFKQRSPYLPHL